MNKVGLRTLFFTDTNRSNWQGNGLRPLLTHIWYPAAADAQEAPMLIGPPDAPLFQAGHAAQDAPIVNTHQQYPLILISHGTGAVALQLGWLASVLAAQGYIVAGVNHHGNTAAEPYTVEGFTRVWERPRDLSVLLDCLLNDEVFGPRIDRERVGAAGFSLGGYTALALAGVRLDFQCLLDAYNSSGRSLESFAPPEFPDSAALIALIQKLTREDAHRQLYSDDRVKVAFAIAPALGEALADASLANIPVKIVVGAGDTNTPPALNAQRYADEIAAADLTILDGEVGHYTFLAEGTAHGRELLPHLCLDHPNVDRAAVHKQVAELAVAFLNTKLTEGL
jgi:predicted dienelactone hydrolase